MPANVANATTTCAETTREKEAAFLQRGSGESLRRGYENLTLLKWKREGRVRAHAAFNAESAVKLNQSA
jgi:hypothetical protein